MTNLAVLKFHYLILSQQKKSFALYDVVLFHLLWGFFVRSFSDLEKFLNTKMHSTQEELHLHINLIHQCQGWSYCSQNFRQGIIFMAVLGYLSVCIHRICIMWDKKKKSTLSCMPMLHHCRLWL